MASASPPDDERTEGVVTASWGEGGDIAPSLDVSNEVQEQGQMDDKMAESTEMGDFGAASTQEYDPAGPSVVSSAAPLTSPPPAATARPAVVAAASAPKQTTIGGFVVGDDSDEEEEGEAVANDGPAFSSVPVPDASAGGQVASQDQPSTEHVTNGVAQATSTSFPPVNTQQGPPDVVAILENRVREDARGEMDSWLSLIDEVRGRNNIEGIRSVYGRFVDIFPQSATAWAKWIEYEIDNYNFAEAEGLFGRCLMAVPNVELWTVYLNYIRRRNGTVNDPDGTARKVVTQAYDFVLNNIGMDKDSGRIWQDYVQFIKSGPGSVGGSTWQDQHKMDQLRKAFHRAIAVPTPSVNTLWKEYEQFESALNKSTARKFTAERNPTYMTAKGANFALENMTRRLNRTTYPRLPPAPGFDGDIDFAAQLEIWRKWIAYEKDDPMVIKDEDPNAFKQRVLYCFKQALMAMRFVPELWVDAAEWCFKNQVMNGSEDTGLQFLTQGISANPESVLLALKHADRIESTFSRGDSDEAKQKHADAVREPYDRLLDTLYDLCKDLKEKEQSDVADMEKSMLGKQPGSRRSVDGDEDDDDEKTTAAAEHVAMRVAALKASFTARSELLSKTISHVWIALARAMRRIQGKGRQTKSGSYEGGLRQTFLDARKKGRLTSDVYVAVAQMESVVYGDPVGAKIFERGLKLFPADEHFVLEYLKHLHSKNDTTNARVIFEKCVTSLSKPESVHKTKILFSYFHKHESQFGELDQVVKLEERMKELFPNDPNLVHFTERFQSETFNPITARIIVSPNVQLRPKHLVPSIERAVSVNHSPGAVGSGSGGGGGGGGGFGGVPSPRAQYIRATASPKRPFPGADDHYFDERPRKLARGESPLKGAAGRRLDQQQRRHQVAAINREITFFLSILPRAETYNGPRINHAKLTGLLTSVPVPDFGAWKATQEKSLAGAAPAGAGGSGGTRGGSVVRASATPRPQQPPPVDFAAIYGQYQQDPRASGQPPSPYGAPPQQGRLVQTQSIYQQQQQQGRPESRGYEQQQQHAQGYPPRSDSQQYGAGYPPPQQQQPQYGRYPNY